MLWEVAGRRRAAVRSHDTVARLGGDEFAVVCPDILDSAEVERVAGRVARLAEPLPAISLYIRSTATHA